MLQTKTVITSLIVLVLVFAFLLLIKYFNIYYPLYVVNTTRSSELSVVGEGKVEATPDTAYINAGISVTAAPTVESAKKTIDDTHNKIVDALKKLNIDPANIKTTAYSINPNNVYNNGANSVNGYNGNASLSIKITDTSKVANVIDTVTQSGANEIQGVQFTINKPEKYQEEARNQAIENAKTQAQKLASQLGIKLGKVTNIVEASPNQPIPLYQSAPMAVGLGGGSTPQVQPGTQAITSTVTLYFEKN